MADSKLSNLAAATVPLDGTELHYIVQSGVDKQVSVIQARGQDVLTGARTYYVSIFTGTIAGGTLYTDGYYSEVSLTGGTGTGATADIIVSGGSVTVVKPISQGNGAYIVGDILSASAASIGGTGSGFTFTITAIGSNNNNGLSAAAPFLTVQYAFDNIIPLVTKTYPITVQCANGVYTSSTAGTPVLNVHDQWLGGGALTFQGDTTNAAARRNVSWVSTGGSSIGTVQTQEPVVLPHDLVIQYVQLIAKGSFSSPVFSESKGEVELNYVDFACENNAGPIYANGPAVVIAQSGDCTLLSTSIAFFVYADNNAQINLLGLGNLSILSLTGTSSCAINDGFYQALNRGVIYAGGTLTSGSFSGIKYNVATDGYVFSNVSEAASYGDTAGVITNGVASFTAGTSEKRGLNLVDPIRCLAIQTSPAQTISALPLSSTVTGRSYLVSDSSTTTFWATYGGTGSTTVRITSDGSSSWKVG